MLFLPKVYTRPSSVKTATWLLPTTTLVALGCTVAVVGSASMTNFGVSAKVFSPVGICPR